MRAICLPVLLLGVALCGCAAANHDQTINGTDFDESKIAQIRKSVTTDGQVTNLFGQPASKEILSETQVIWHYDYQAVTHTDRFTPFVGDVKQTLGYDKRLDFLMQDDVVVNFAYARLPICAEKDIPVK